MIIGVHNVIVVFNCPYAGPFIVKHTIFMKLLVDFLRFYYCYIVIETMTYLKGSY